MTHFLHIPGKVGLRLMTRLAVLHQRRDLYRDPFGNRPLDPIDQQWIVREREIEATNGRRLDVWRARMRWVEAPTARRVHTTQASAR
jgi:hypothetical protein